MRSSNANAGTGRSSPQDYPKLPSGITVAVFRIEKVRIFSPEHGAFRTALSVLCSAIQCHVSCRGLRRDLTLRLDTD
jgi:hypothetical protein